MGFFAAWRLKRAARRYARVLPGLLARSYGAGERYPVRQIEAALTLLKLPRDFAALAYAAFLAEEDYEANRAKYPRYMPYNDAREALLAAIPSRVGAPWGGAPDSIGSTDVGGADGGHSGDG
jgi:hypothetical protein